MDTFSLSVADELFSAFPEWRSLARIEQGENEQPYLVVEVAAPPQADVEHGLVIDTANNEVTVGFDCYHSHFDSVVGDGEQFGTLAALQFVKQLLSERVGVVSWWFNTEWRGSAQLQAGVPVEVPSWANQGNVNRIRVRSWKGSLNADISL